MTDDLLITDKQYLIALTVFFFPYSLFEVRTGVRAWFASYTDERTWKATEQHRFEEAAPIYVAFLYNACMGYRHGVLVSTTSAAKYTLTYSQDDARSHHELRWPCR